MVVATSTAAATGGGGAVTRYMVDVQSTTAVESVSLHQGSDPNTTVVTTGTRKANGSYEVTVPSAGATDALSTFVRIRYVDGNSVETSLAAVAR